MSSSDLGTSLKLDIEDLYCVLRKLEEAGFIITVRSGQYFVRKYFTKNNDLKYKQTYDDFEILE